MSNGFGYGFKPKEVLNMAYSWILFFYRNYNNNIQEILNQAGAEEKAEPVPVHVQEMLGGYDQ